MATFRVGMELNRHLRLQQRRVIAQSIPDRIHVVVFVLQQKCRQGLRGDVAGNVRVEVEGSFLGMEMAGIKGNSEVFMALALGEEMDANFGYAPPVSITDNIPPGVFEIEYTYLPFDSKNIG